jgi:hypothetical protein
MIAAQSPLQPPRYLTGIGISLAVHLLLILLWQASQPTLLSDDAPSRVQFLRLLPAPAARTETPAPALPARTPTPSRGLPGQGTPQAAPQPEAATAIISAPSEPVDSPAAPPASSPSLLERAKAAAGGIDRSLRKENPGRGIHAPVVTATMKLERGIARAAELAPNKWYQAPKVEEIIDPGGYGRRRYRVTTAMGTYCVTYESNHGPDGRDTMRDGIPPKKTNCEDDEQPATFQDWNHKGL